MSDGSKIVSAEVSGNKDVSNPYDRQLENVPLDICGIKLDGTNYLIWSRTFTLAIEARGMSDFIEGPVTQPEEAVALKKFKSQKSLVMTWLFNSMRADIRHTFLLLDTPHKIWTTAKQTYSQQGNDAQCFDLRKKLRTLDQHHRSVAEYFAELSGMWQEFDFYQGFQAVCTVDAANWLKRLEKERVYDFLAGLDVEYDQIRVQVLGRVPFPSLGEAYAIVQQEESRRGAMLHTPPSDRSALIVTPQGGKLQTGTSNGANDRESLRCDYCQNTGHTRDFCWKLHGRPPRGRGSGRSGRGRGTVRPQAQAHVSESTVVASSPGSGFISSEQVDGFSQGEMQALRRLMAQADSSPTIAPTSTSSYFAHTGISANAFTVSSSISWIIDSGASDHLTGCSSIFDSYLTCSGKDKVRIADGSFSCYFRERFCSLFSFYFSFFCASYSKFCH